MSLLSQPIKIVLQQGVLCEPNSSASLLGLDSNEQISSPVDGSSYNIYFPHLGSISVFFQKAVKLFVLLAYSPMQLFLKSCYFFSFQIRLSLNRVSTTQTNEIN